MNEVTVRDFQPGDEGAFRSLNEEWIERWFALEPSDVAMLNDPNSYILGRGGHILMAVRAGDAVGCCALVRMAEGEYEVAKMAVAPAARRAGVGRQVLAAAMAKARSLGARRLYLETNSSLIAAVTLYEQAGFAHLPQFVSPYRRADVAMEKWL